jgi:predicted acetyltransferase
VIDFSKCEICTPTGAKLRHMYEKLWQIFPYDRPIYTEMMDTGKNLYTMTNYALFQNDHFLGNVGLYPVSVWYEGVPLELIGVGAVAVVPEYRRMGIARYLLQHCMNIIDNKNKPSILFTEEPGVYREHGFEILEQDYYAVKAIDIDIDIKDCAFKYFETISSSRLQEMAYLYENASLNFNGKVIRTRIPDYWQYYEMMFNPYLKPRIVWNISDKKRLQGYCRFEMEEDSIGITECCAPANDNNSIIESLLGFIGRFGKLTGRDIITICLPPDHTIWNFLKSRSINVFREPQGVRREIFMVRPVKGSFVESVSKLYWSLADKF